MENFAIESRYLNLCNEFNAVTRCMKAAFYRPDYQKLLMYSLIKRLGRAFVSKHLFQAFETLSRAFETLGLSSAESLKSSAACLCYNMAHAVPFSDGRMLILTYSKRCFKGKRQLFIGVLEKNDLEFFCNAFIEEPFLQN